MNPNIIFAINLVILLPVIIGLIKIRRIDSSYYPILILLLLGAINEVAGRFLIQKTGSNSLQYNVFSLLEALLLTWQFYNWRYSNRYKLYFYLLPVLFLVTWIVEGVMLSDLRTGFVSYFIIFSSFAIVLLSINKINGLIIRQKEDLLKQPAFLMSIAFIIFFTYSIIVEIFWSYGFGTSKVFTSNVYFILNFVNLLVNLILAVAILWIPNKQRFLMLSS